MVVEPLSQSFIEAGRWRAVLYDGSARTDDCIGGEGESTRGAVETNVRGNRDTVSAPPSIKDPVKAASASAFENSAGAMCRSGRKALWFDAGARLDVSHHG